ncbi:hypothetical protein LPW11_10195 [Geomonas sp. RF6]|uniref:hypothetical protein n=1 Tax=Geomonas sp. RF6 TaxID=2897342 RepID=UPI001E388143|nr:hypothetical protein [Geomonas sp. RF6]UFS72545.1 hypothetical protein LPW11_10195 [Geomonas sp. RF6]
MMGVAYKRNSAVFSDTVGAEEAETLLEWLQKHPKGKLDLAACTHLHAANLQVLMAARLAIHKYPTDESLAAWVKTALHTA